MKFYPHRQMSESFITAAFLSVSGGLQDAYTYIFRGKVFANAQTGNIVLLGQNLVDRNWRMCVHYAVPLLFFALGIAAAECIKQKFQNMQQFHWRQIVVLCEIFLLLMFEKLINVFPVIRNHTCSIRRLLHSSLNLK